MQKNMTMQILIILPALELDKISPWNKWPTLGELDASTWFKFSCHVVAWFCPVLVRVTVKVVGPFRYSV